MDKQQNKRPTSCTQQCDEKDPLFVKKRQKVQPFTVREKAMIINVYAYVYSQLKNEVDIPLIEEPKVTDVVIKTGAILGMCKSTIYKVLKEFKENEEFRAPRKPGPKSVKKKIKKE